MSIFDEIDALGIAEDHAQDVLGLEETSAQKLLAVYTRIAKALRLRLRQDRQRQFPEVLPADIRDKPNNTFTDQQMRGVLIQLEAAILGLKGGLNEESARAADLIGNMAIKQLAREIEVFNDAFKGAIAPIDFAAVRSSLDTSNMLINRYQASIDAYSAGLRQTIATGLQEAVIAQSTTDTVIDKLGSFFEGEEWRLRRIVRTELHNIYGQSKLGGMGEIVEKYEPKLQKTLYHPLDSRTAEDSQYVMRLKLVRDIDQPFNYKWHGQERVYMAPPDRPNDRSILIPLHPSWR